MSQSLRRVLEIVIVLVRAPVRRNQTHWLTDLGNDVSCDLVVALPQKLIPLSEFTIVLSTT